jgi:RNA-directed DNA polymerase
VRQWTASAGLLLHPVKTRIVDAWKGGFDFLGYHFERGQQWPRQKSLRQLKETIRSQTRRNRGTSLKVIISEVNRTLKGWMAYFQYSHRKTFPDLDRWVRTRLRSLLRRRRGGRGYSSRWDHIRWPNAFFAEQGLYSLVAARARACQSLKR